MTVPTEQPAWYHQIRWRLTLSYGVVFFIIIIVVECLFLAFAILYAYSRNPVIEPVHIFLTQIQQILADDLLVLPLLLMVGHAISGHFGQRLESLVYAVSAWEKGQFDVHVEDESLDEIGVLTRELEEMASQLEKTVKTEKALAAAKERDRVLRDLHDTVKQQIFALQMELTAVRNLLVVDPEAAAAIVDEAIGHSRQAQYDLNSLIAQTPPAGLDLKTLGMVIGEYVERMERLGTNIEVHVTGDQDLPTEIEVALFRVAQGALSNVIRHSKAESATVEVDQNEKRVLLRITDTGIGFDQHEPRMQEFGLESMRARMAEIGGTLMIHSQPGAGTILTAQAPIQADGESA